jgi:hypothetical protein
MMLPAFVAAVMTGIYQRVFKFFFGAWRSFSHKDNDFKLRIVETILRYQL